MKSSLILLTAAIVGTEACEHHLHFRTHDRHLIHDTHSNHLRRNGQNASSSPILTPNERILVDSFNNNSLASSSYYYTHGRHVAGENKSMAVWTAERWKENGWDTRLDEYDVFLNYPVHQSIRLTYANGSTYIPSLQEDQLDSDPTTSYPNGVPAFNGYSASGNVSASYVYVGRGHTNDFKALVEKGVDLEGKIALAKYGGPFRGVKVKNAAAHGMAGVILFTDPSDDGVVTEAHGVKAYPEGPAREPSSIQRGTVMDISTYPGDPTTPGHASKPDSLRVEGSNIPSIPSIPISWAEARPILRSLNGHGIKLNTTGWVGAIPNVTYHTGPAPGATISLSNIMENKTTPIWDVIGIITGTNEDEVVVVGNHRDAWMVGGAADPNAGTAILVEMSKAFGKLMETGWKPRRTIVMANWDGEEYGLLGSTEWVEEHLPWLNASAVAYLNTDVAISGSIPDVSATPDMNNITTATMQKVLWPEKNMSSPTRTMYDVWTQHSGEIGLLGAQSDYAPFLALTGIASIDLGTTRDRAVDPIYHYHSNFDSYAWMERFCDPGFARHKAVGEYLALILYHLVDSASVPLEPGNYATEMAAYLEDLNTTVGATGNSSAAVDLEELRDAITLFTTSAQQFNARRAKAVASNDSALLTELNHRARDFSRAFTSQGGLPGRAFYQNMIFAPSVEDGYTGITFPGIREQAEKGEVGVAREFVGRSAEVVRGAAGVLGRAV